MKFPLKRNKVLIVLIGILIVASLLFYQNRMKNFFYLVSQPIQEKLWQTGINSSKFFEAISKIRNLKGENEKLIAKNEALLAEMISLKELKKENEILREALNLNLTKDFKLVLAHIIGKDAMQDYILINKGTKDGIEKDMPVISSQKILFGKISQVYENFSQVSLITNQESSFDAKILKDDEEIYGLVKGEGSALLLLDLLPKDKEIKEGDIVITTPLSGIFPQNLLVGEVKEILRSDAKTSSQAKIQPFYNLNGLEKIFIIIDF